MYLFLQDGPRKLSLRRQYGIPDMIVKIIKVLYTNTKRRIITLDRSPHQLPVQGAKSLLEAAPYTDTNLWETHLTKISRDSSIKLENQGTAINR